MLKGKQKQLKLLRLTDNWARLKTMRYVCKMNLMTFCKKNIFFGITLFLLLLNTNGYSEVVNKVEVIGNERISLETIASIWRYIYRQGL